MKLVLLQYWLPQCQYANNQSNYLKDGFGQLCLAAMMLIGCFHYKTREALQHRVSLLCHLKTQHGSRHCIELSNWQTVLLEHAALHRAKQLADPPGCACWCCDKRRLIAKDVVVLEEEVAVKMSCQGDSYCAGNMHWSYKATCSSCCLV